MLKQDVQSVEPDLQSIFRLNCDFQIDFSADEAIFFDILLLCYVFIRRDHRRKMGETLIRTPHL